MLRDSSDSLYDQLRGGSGADILRSTGGGTTANGTVRTLRGGAGADRIVSSGAGDDLWGGRGDDHLVARARFRGAKIASGGQGQDILSLGAGARTVRLLGDGDSIRVDSSDSATTIGLNLNYFYAPGPVKVDLQAGYGRVIGSSVKDKFLGLFDEPNAFLALKGTNGDDILLGTDFPHPEEYLDGLDGDDVLRGRDGPDTLRGRAGDDLLDGGAGDDGGSGGSGTDTCIDMEYVAACELP
jgi:trimeric autotransporter adhesin